MFVKPTYPRFLFGFLSLLSKIQENKKILVSTQIFPVKIRDFRGTLYPEFGIGGTPLPPPPPAAATPMDQAIVVTGSHRSAACAPIIECRLFAGYYTVWAGLPVFNPDIGGPSDSIHHCSRQRCPLPSHVYCDHVLRAVSHSQISSQRGTYVT